MMICLGRVYTWRGRGDLTFLPASKLEAMARRLIADFRSVIVLAGTGHLIIQFSMTLFTVPFFISM